MCHASDANEHVISKIFFEVPVDYRKTTLYFILDLVKNTAVV